MSETSARETRARSGEAALDKGRASGEAAPQERISTDEAPWIRAARLSKWYGKITALQHVSVHLDHGIWGLLGPNGSGKTTFLRLAAGQLRPNVGTVTVRGQAPFANPHALRHLGVCPEPDALYDELTAEELVTAMAELSGYARNEAHDRAVTWLDAFGLRDDMARRVGTYSRGMRQRVKLAQSMVHEPDVLLLDEPLTATDPPTRRIILERIRERADQGALVLFSTHVLHEVEALTDRVLVLAQGRLVAHGRTHEIRDLLEEHPHHVRVACDRPRELAAALMHIEGIAGLRFPEPDTLELETHAPDATYAAVASEIVRTGIHVESITSPDATLEALFHYLVARSTHMSGTGADRGTGRGRPHDARAASKQASSTASRETSRDAKEPS